MALHDLETTIAATSAATSASPIPQAGLGGGECRWVPHASPVGGSGRLLPRFVAISREVSPDTGCSATQLGSSLEYKAEVRGPRSEPPARSKLSSHPSTTTYVGERRRALRGAHLRRHPGVITPYPDPRRFVRACARKEEGAEGVGDKKEKGEMVEGRRTEQGRAG